MGFHIGTSPYRAPGWVGSTSDENFNNSMASSKISKRLCPDSDSDSDTSISFFLRFVVLESLEDEHLTKINPFVVHKVISGIVKSVSVKKLNNGTLLIEVDKKKYADNLLNIRPQANLKKVPRNRVSFQHRGD